MEKRCNTCSQDIIDTHLRAQRCSGCKHVYYCNIECQKLDWKNHWKECYTSPPYCNRIRRLKNKTMQLSFDIRLPSSTEVDDITSNNVYNLLRHHPITDPSTEAKELWY